MSWLSWRSRSRGSEVTAQSSPEQSVSRAAQASSVANNDPSPTLQTPSTSIHSQRVLLQPQTWIATAILTTICLGCFQFHRTFLRRIPEAANIPTSFFRKRSIFGKVTSVGDGDNFRIYHTPGGRITGWGWLPWRKVPQDRKKLKNKTIHIRIAGVDAPELAHFGRLAQPYSKDALDWLTTYLLGRQIRAYVYKIDQYGRVVATVYVRKSILRRDVGLQMLRAGYATVYEAKSGAEFGTNMESKYRKAEGWAKIVKKGMWAGDMTAYESPHAYKSRHRDGNSIVKPL